MIDALEELRQMSKRMDDISRAMIIDPFSDGFFDVFTRKRMELVRAIMSESPRSIRDLAERVERDIKNVFNDLKLLQNCNIVEFEQKGRCKRPVVKRKTIIFKFTRGEQV